MNKEEVLNTFLLANIPEIITQEEFNDVKKAIKHLLQENKQYKEVIDKVIKEIKKELKENNHLSYGVALSIIVTLNYYEEILKGDSNE